MRSDRLPVLTVYGHEYCHLCHDMVDALRQLQQQVPFELEILDLEGDAVLEEKFGELVPVLMGGDEEICHYHLDHSALQAFLAKAGGT